MFPGRSDSRLYGEIKRLECDDSLREVIFNLRLPVLAICVGMQALMTHSEENEGVDCLNIIEGKVKRFPDDLKGVDSDILKVPHMGWNEVIQTVPVPFGMTFLMSAFILFTAIGCGHRIGSTRSVGRLWN